MYPYIQPSVGLLDGHTGWPTVWPTQRPGTDPNWELKGKKNREGEEWGQLLQQLPPGSLALARGVCGISLLCEILQVSHNLVIDPADPTRRQVYPLGPPAFLFQSGYVLTRIRLHFLKLFPTDNTHHNVLQVWRAS